MQPADEQETAEPRTLVVDGHRFLVRPRPAEPGVYDVDWTTGPRAYGFTCRTASRRAMSPDDVEEAIRSFLAQVNPNTGYID